MSSETDHPRQRTVAELLAQHGDVNATGRRRRRRAADGSDESDAAPAVPGAPAASERQAPPGQSEPGGRRRADREPDPWDPEPAPWPSPAAESGWDQRQQAEPQPWESGAQQWGATDWDSPAQDDAWDGQPAAPAAPRGRRHRDPEAWESGQQAWTGVPAEQEPTFPAAEPWTPRAGQAPDAAPDPQSLEATTVSPVRDRPTEHIPRVRDAAPGLDVSLTRPIQPHRPADADGYDDEGYDADGYGYRRDGYDPDDDGPPTMVGAAPAGAEDWHRERTRGRRGPAGADDGGPPTEAAGPIDFDDGPAGLGGRGFDQGDGFSDGFEDFYGGGQEQLPPPPVPNGQAAGRRARPGDPDADGPVEGDESAAAEDGEGKRKRLTEAVSDAAGQTWAAVIAQWIAGAVGGAALWVGFRFLWRSLPVVALAAAVLVTIGLVVVVRALLRNNDLRTTLFAVLVGLLLTVSPAILVLMGR